MMGMMTSILVGLNFGRSGEGRDEHGIIIIFILVSVDQLRSGYHGISYPRRCNDMSDWVRDGSSSGYGENFVVDYSLAIIMKC